jgi:hypothetical protein
MVESVTATDAVVVEAISRVEVKIDSFDVRLRTLEVGLATITATVNRPAPLWPSIVSAVVPNLISAAALIIVLLRTGQ